MLTAALKTRMESLPPNDFTAAWKCIEQIERALDNATGGVALTALTYVRASYEERLARVAHMRQTQVINQAATIAANQAQIRGLQEISDKQAHEIAALERKLARAKKKSKK